MSPQVSAWPPSHTTTIRPARAGSASRAEATLVGAPMATTYSGESPVRDRSIRSLAAGLDTDSNAATVGSVFGALYGATAIPAELRAAGGERLTSAVQGFDGIEISALAERSLRLAEHSAAGVTV